MVVLDSFINKNYLFKLSLLGSLLTLTGCQLGYYMHSGVNQIKLVNSRIPIDQALAEEKLSEEQRQKLLLVKKVKQFAETDLGLKPSKNYSSYIQLKDPYVTYIVQAAHAHELKPYLWSFPFVGKVPYKGYFSKDKALAEAKSFDPLLYDTYVRGVSAYSTLGWFQDSVLSSMLRYADHELVELIIHETVHTTLFIKNEAEFNERMATFLGLKGMNLFYLKTEGPESKHLKLADQESRDQKLFSDFLSREIKDLKQWYEDHRGKVTEETKKNRLKDIQARFKAELRPHLSANAYADFETRELNNAYLLAYKTYEYDMVDFENLYKKMDQDFAKTLTFLKSLEKSKEPSQELKKL